jgi:photosystem II stability/assembly factor-like uncharacterized protein
MKSISTTLIILSIYFLSCKSAQNATSYNSIISQKINFDSEASFRGIHGNNKQIWLAGSNSEVWKYDVLNNSMQNVSPFQDSHVQFRDVECLGKDTAIIMTAGFRAMLLKTNNGGTTWDTVLQDNDSLAFFDGLDFENEKGILFGDPLNGMLQVFSSNNYGNTWQQDTSVYLKELNPIEAGFAASGTSILFNNGNVYISLGGNQARIFSKKSTWKTTNTPMAQGGASKGIYSLDFYSNIGVAVGGQYDNPNDDSTRIYTTDGGLNWSLGQGVDEYRSSVVMINTKTGITGGPSGIDITNDGGKTWGKVSELDIHALYWQKNSTKGYAVGGNGGFYSVKLINH